MAQLNRTRQEQGEGGQKIKKFIPQNLAVCYDGERVYYKDLPSGRCFTTKDCSLEITETGVPIKR